MAPSAESESELQLWLASGFEAKRKARADEDNAVASLGQRLIEPSLCVPESAGEGVFRDDPQANLVGDEDDGPGKLADDLGAREDC